MSIKLPSESFIQYIYNVIKNQVMKLSTVKKRLKGFGDVQNMYSPRWNGGKVANQFEITFDNGRVFKSYDSIIVVEVNGRIYLGKDWNYSKTTNQYRNMFLNENLAETRAKIKDGTYKILE